MFFNIFKNRSTNMFIELKRVYKLKGKNKDLKTQKFTVAVEAIESVRPSNRLGHPDHRATLTLASGGEVDLNNKYTEVVKLMKAG